MSLFILLLLALALGPAGFFWLLDAVVKFFAATFAACLVFQCPANGPGTLPDPAPAPTSFAWYQALEASRVGVLSAIWGSATDDIFVVGGTPSQGEIYHYDGAAWRAMDVPPVPLLIWVYGFAPDDCLAVGVGGGVLRYDGAEWTALDSGMTEDLWGVWGSAPDDVWIVGGTIGRGEPELIHFDGEAFTPVPVPENDRGASSLFKVFGIGSKVFAVGENGLIIGLENGVWSQSPAGNYADDDFVSLWGTSEDHIIAVGGRASARIAVYDGNAWTTVKPQGVPGLNGVFVPARGVCYIGGINGFVGLFDFVTGSVTQEDAPSTPLALHALWAPDDSGRAFAVGGRFNQPYEGLAFIRSDQDPGEPAPPLGLSDECTVAADCPPGRDCVEGECVPVAGCSGTDSDGDGWLDTCDNCADAANPLQEDSDLDAAGDACDACPGFDDAVDSDADGLADGCDICPNDNPDDTDGDDVCDSLDACPGFDDSVDADGDGVPNGCDVCSGDDVIDSDSDGVPDACDACPGFDDGVDADGDGVPNGCDACPSDNPNDTDGDGVCDSQDACPGFDDSVDSNGNGVPDGCCAIESDCPLGQNCGEGGFCVPAEGPDLEFGAGGGPNACLEGGYQRIDDGGLLHVCEGFQGLVDCLLNVRVTGFAPNAQVTITAVLTEEGVPPCDMNPDCGFPQPQCQIPDIPTPFCVDTQCTWTGEIPRNHVLTSQGGGLNEAVDFNVFVFGRPDCVDGKPTHFTITMSQNSDPAITVTREYNLTFSVRRRCLNSGSCPPGEPCVSNFCQPD